ncbi:hypothetical protein [Enterovirga rhinocerotis]|uniref:hypothetical protein n=1 Tax=Enterovirga rhinocerotis TaxID=1339210 RepID=UPI00106145C5|nr:hypothetical protein [Enterovirga rhinocerotis]
MAVVLSFVLPAEAQPVQQRQVGSWVLKWGKGRMGAYCTVETAQAGRTLGYQALKSGEGYFGIRNPAWAWTPRAAYDVRLSIAGGAEWSGKAVSALPDTLVLPVAANSDPAPVAAMEAGRSASLEVEGGTITFDLTDFPEAAKAQRDCLAQPG